MEILARFDYEKINHAQDNQPHLLVSLKAPSLDWVEKRPRIAILPCIDLSGSMQGNKLEYAKRSCRTLIEHLAEGDYAGLAWFHNHAKIEVAPQRVTPEFKETLKQAVDNLYVGGGTNLCEGLVASVECLQGLDLPPSFLHRVIMFTDGMPTVGLADPKAILGILAKKRALATVSAFGYGTERGGEWGGIDQDFLTELSAQGKGNYAFVQNPDDALAAFGRELGGLLSTYATDLTVSLKPVNGRIGKVVTNVSEVETDVTGGVDLSINDIRGEEMRHLVFQCDINARNKAFPRPTTIFEVMVAYDVLTEDGSKERKIIETKARLQFVREADVQTEPTPEVDAIVALHQTIRAQLEAEAEAKNGNYAAASRWMDDIAAEVAARGHANVAAAANETSRRLGTEAAYISNRAYLTSFANAGTRAYGTSSINAEAGEVLTSCNVALNNSAMQQFETSFTGRAAVPAANLVDASGNSIVIPSSE